MIKFLTALKRAMPMPIKAHMSWNLWPQSAVGYMLDIPKLFCRDFDSALWCRNALLEA